MGFVSPGGGSWDVCSNCVIMEMILFGDYIVFGRCVSKRKVLEIIKIIIEMGLFKWNNI